MSVLETYTEFINVSEGGKLGRDEENNIKMNLTEIGSTNADKIRSNI
jgi:hypothetical protein